MCVCVCVWERERERERLLLCEKESLSWGERSNKMWCATKGTKTLGLKKKKKKKRKKEWGGC
jgi:hypothetical protein